MILETYKLSICDLKVTCSTTIYKNLSLTMRIQNRQYTIVPSTGLFDGTSTVKSRLIDTVYFQFDLERNKYLPKQIQLELKLIYRTGKINQKIYPLNFNEFTTTRKGVKEKLLKVVERLYSLQCTITTKSNGTDSPFFNHQFNGLQRVKSEKQLQKQELQVDQLHKRRYYKSRSPQPVIKYTINQNIKITRTQQPIQNSKVSQKSIHQQHQKQILRQNFQLDDQQSSSFAQRNKQFTQRIKKSIQVQQYPIKAINDRIKFQILENSVTQLTEQLRIQKEKSYRLQKQIATLKNKMEHLYHEKGILVKQREQDRLVFETKDKQEKIRQKRDIQQLRRHYEALISQKDTQIAKLTSQLKQTYTVSINNLNLANQCQNKSEELSTFFNKRVVELQKEINIKNQQIYIQNIEITSLRKQSQYNRNQIQTLEIETAQLRSHIKNLQVELNHYHNQLNPQFTKSTQVNVSKTQSSVFNQEFFQQSNNILINSDNEQLMQLVDKQTKTYHEMISKLEDSILRLQSQLSILKAKDVRNSNELQQKIIQIKNYNKIISQLTIRITLLQSQLQSQKAKVSQIKSLFSEFNHTQSSLKDKIQKDKKNIRYRSYSLGNQVYGGQTIKIKTTQRYRFVYEPQSSIIYVPPVKHVSNIFSPQKQQEYGTRFNQYNKTDMSSQNVEFQSLLASPYVQYTNGYFGVPLDLNKNPEKSKRYRSNIENQLNESNKEYSFSRRDDSPDRYSRKSFGENNSVRNNYFNEDSFIQKNKDEYVVQNSQDSYINENGDYVKERRRTVFKKN